MMHTKFVHLEFNHYSEIVWINFLQTLPVIKKKKKQTWILIFSKKKNHCDFTVFVHDAKCAGGGGVFCDQNKCYLPWSRDSLDFRNVAPQGRESAPSEGRGQNQIVPYGCLLLLLSWIHTQCRHYVTRIGIRGATMRQSRISEHQSLTSFFLLGTWTMLTAIQMTDQVLLDR